MKRIAELIADKRNGGVLSPADIEALIGAYARGDVPDYQMAAMAMAIYFQGLTPAELEPWTNAMLNSGEVIDLQHIAGAKVDKHSTGGVGDKISLPLAPLVASCGIKVPMISGRGLGHTGGTLDKLESIPGFSTNLSVEAFKEHVDSIGAALIGQTGEVCPADKRLYALRDVTATVESIPLIASSIMSKKLAEGIEALVLDVKVGSGAFMRSIEDARELAETMVGIGERMGKRTVALLTDMSQPLGRQIGNAMEVRESIDILNNKGPADVRRLTVELAKVMVELGGGNPNEVEDKLVSGAALSVFEEIIEAQGGDPAVCHNQDLLPEAAHRVPYPAKQGGYVTAMDTRRIGLAAVVLGAGRSKTDDVIDPAVGLEMAVRLGDRVEPGQPLLWIHHNGEGLDNCHQHLDAAFGLGESADPIPELILERIG